MRKIASHYWLRPDGSIGKFPVITLGDDNKIVEIREREKFEEEPSLELVNGFLIPGFVDFFPEEVEPPYAKCLNRYVINGVKLLGVPDKMWESLKGYATGQPELVKVDLCNVEDGLTFDKIKSSKDSLSALIKYTKTNAALCKKSDQYGTLAVGKKPGLLSVTKMDYTTFRVNNETKLKIVI